MDFRQEPIESVRVRHWNAEGEIVSDETIRFRCSHGRAMDEDCAGCSQEHAERDHVMESAEV
jgi:hypothetical protein